MPKWLPRYPTQFRGSCDRGTARDSAGQRSQLAHESVVIGGLATEGDRLSKLFNLMGESVHIRGRWMTGSDDAIAQRKSMVITEGSSR